MSPDTSVVRRAVVCLLGGTGILGIAHVALLPPWEGFDEEAHYSSLQQLADTHEVPRLGRARISEDAQDYRQSAPVRYGNAPGRDRKGPHTYRSFFEASPDVVAQGRSVVHGRPLEARHYTASAKLNWEAQHPPLYYAVLSPVYVLTRGLSWGAQLFALRAVSYLLAWLALVVGVYVCATVIPTLRGGALHRDWLMLGVAAWPLVFPGWFPEMARLGNDSLCALIVAAVWWSTARAIGHGPDFRYAWTVGLLLGLGWLTKALFIPVTLGLGAFWCIRECSLGGARALARLSLRLLVAGALIAAISGWWYIGNWREYGVAVGSIEIVRLNEAGGLASGLEQRFTVGAIVRFGASFATRLAWPSTWSLARPPYIYLVPMVLAVLLATAAYLSALRRFRPTGLEWLPLWLTAPFVAGFVYQMLVLIALTGQGSGFGGYYLHLLVVPLGSALGLGVGVWWRHAGTRILATAFVLYSAVFAVAISWAQVLLFAGILGKSESKFYQMPPKLPPLLGLPEALARMTVLAYPFLGAIAWLVGAGLLLVGMLTAWKITRALAPAGPGAAR
jgi:hypothetical protein